MADVLLGGVAAHWLYDNSRKTFKFDSKQIMKRQYQAQSMNIKRFSQYRDDVRDLVDLTVAKMDNYLVISTLQLGFTLTLFTEGRPTPGRQPAWLHLLYAINNVGAMLYFIFAMWHSMHASLTAHAFGVTMLTQFVRLPVPTTEDMDMARAFAQDFESQNLTQMFRIPGLKKQLKNLISVMDEMDRNERNDSDAASDAGSEAAADVDPSSPNRVQWTPTSMLRHMQLYRQVQGNWQAYDAYARVCMSMGTNQLLAALGYYTISMLFAENDAWLPGVACFMVFSALTYLLCRLDLYLSRGLLTLLGTMLGVMPLLATLAIFFWKLRRYAILQFCSKVLVPFVFILHSLLITFYIEMARAETFDQVSLPVKFRSVLYLDVFGWLQHTQPQQESEAHEPAISSARLNMELTPVAEESQEYESEVGALNQSASELEASTISESRVTFQRQHSQSSSTINNSACLHRWSSLWSSCRAFQDELQLDFNMWKKAARSDQVEMDDCIKNAIKRLELEFDDACSALGKVGMEAEAVCEITPSFVVEAKPTKVHTCWLRLEWNPSGAPLEYFYEPNTEETKWEPPPSTERVCDFITLGERVGEFRRRIEKLGRLPTAEGIEVTTIVEQPEEITLQTELIEEPGQTATGGSRLPRDSKSLLSRTSTCEPFDSTVISSQSSTLAPTGDSTSGEPARAAGEDTTTGGRGSQQPSSLERNEVLQSSAGAAARLHQESVNPNRVPTFGATRHRKPPGQLPWNTFWGGSCALLLVWVMSTIWTICSLWFGLSVPLVPLGNMLAPDQLEPVLVETGSWPHHFFTPRGLACHPDLGPILLVAERYGVLELRMDAIDNEPPVPHPQPDVARCLRNDLDFAAGGLSSISLECYPLIEDPLASSSLTPRQESGSQCSVLLVSAAGKGAMRCPLVHYGDLSSATGFKQAHDADGPASQNMKVYGGPWRQLVAGNEGKFWALGEESLVQLGLRSGTTSELVPWHESEEAEASSTTHLHAFLDKAVIGLQVDGKLHAWSQSKRLTKKWILPQDVKWSGICTTSDSMYLVGAFEGSEAASVWKSQLPRHLFSMR